MAYARSAATKQPLLVVGCGSDLAAVRERIGTLLGRHRLTDSGALGVAFGAATVEKTPKT